MNFIIYFFSFHTEKIATKYISNNENRTQHPGKKTDNQQKKMGACCLQHNESIHTHPVATTKENIEK